MPATSPSTARILIAEDEKPLAHALELKLGHAGHQTTVARNGQECLDFLAKDTYAVLLLDIMMPVKDGFQVLTELQTMPHPPVVFVLSNLSQNEDEERAKSMGAKQYFIKSDTPLATIIEEVEKAL